MSTSSQRYNAAEKLKDAGQLAEAAELVEQLLADDPNYVLGHMMLAKSTSISAATTTPSVTIRKPLNWSRTNR